MSSRSSTRWIFVGVVAMSVAMHLIPYGRYVAYPLVLLSTFAHELGHGVVALLAGGELVAFEMSADGSGVAHLIVPDHRLARGATPAGGLIGPAVLAALFFALARTPRSARTGLLAFGILCFACVVFVVRGLFGLVVVSCFGVVSVVIARRSNPRVARVALALMAVQLSLSVFSRGDYLFTERAGAGPSDVAQMASAWFLPYWFWGAVCGSFSIVVLVAGVRRFLEPRSPRV